jgi:ParB family chromosome partitioning protein
MNSPKAPQRRGLGRGLGSLIPTAAPADPAGDGQDPTPSAGGPEAASGPAPVQPTVGGAYFAEIPVGQIHPNAVQPRQVFEEEAMAELVHSIREVGLLQPVVVRRTGDQEYELVMGERRWRASQARVPRLPPRHGRHPADDLGSSLRRGG